MVEQDMQSELADSITQFSRMPWSPKGSAYASRAGRDKEETRSKIARNLLLATPAEKLRRTQGGSHSIDGTFTLTPTKEGKVSLAKVKPYRKVY